MNGEPDHDVLICGLGPVGQLLALLLGRAGVSVLAIDRAPEPFDIPRAAVVDDEVLRIFQAAGVAEQILADSQVQQQVSFVSADGRPRPLLRPVEGSQGHPPLVSIHQPSIERTLIAALAEQDSVRAAWGRRLVSFEQDGDGVTATVEPGEGGPAETVRSRWLVGCDGGGSWVRQLLGIEFGGSTFRQRWLVVDTLVDRPLTRVPHPQFFGDWRRPIVSLPMSPGRHRWEWMLHPGEDPDPFLEPEALRARIEPWLDDGERAEVERAVVYTFHARVAARWREGRALLAGDAAHLMPPFAGQGFSSGARDAANLAWKLEAVLAGAPEALLDTYEEERRAHVEAMLRLAVTLGSFVQTTDRRVAHLRDLLLGALDRSGIARWAETKVKPLPAYGAGAFAERPARLVFRRGVGAQFPQPRVSVDGRSMPLDRALGAGWTALATSPEAAEALGVEGLRVLQVGRDLDDEEGEIAGWLERFDCRWAILRPDRFVFALGSDLADVDGGLSALHRQVGPAARARLRGRALRAVAGGARPRSDHGLQRTASPPPEPRRQRSTPGPPLRKLEPSPP